MRTSEQKKLQQFIQRLIDPMLANRGFTEWCLLQVIGKSLSAPIYQAKAYLIEISYPTPENRQGNLHLGVLHAYATELQHQVPFYVKKSTVSLGMRQLPMSASTPCLEILSRHSQPVLC